MAKKKHNGHALPRDVLQARLNLYSSGAAGVHADQQSKRTGVPYRNRIHTRSAQRRAAIRDQHN